MISFDDVTGENIKNIIQIGLKFLIIYTDLELLEAKHQENQLQDYSDDINKIYLHSNDPCQAKY